MKKITYIFFTWLLFAQHISNAQVQRVRIAFESPLGYVRPLLLGFDPTNNATDGVDFGWDVLNFDDIPGDLNWLIENDRYVVQGVGAFDETKVYPFGLYLTYSGTITISLYALENFTQPVNVYIYDAYQDTYTLINTSDLIADVSSGDYLDRFFIAFMEPELLSTNENNLKETKVQYFSNTKELSINTFNKSSIKQIVIHNLLGQKVFLLKDINKSKINISLQNLTTDLSIVTIITDNGSINKKIITN